MSEARPNDGRALDRVLRVLLPVAALAAGVLIWELVVRLNEHSALHAAQPLAWC